MCIYIVEDDKAVLDSLKVFLVDLDYNVEGFLCAEEFFKQTVPTSSDSVIVDLCLPQIHGTQLIRWIQALRDRPNIIAISGQIDSEINEQLRCLYKVKIIRKPLVISNLLNSL